MTISEMFFSLLISPLELLFETIFSYCWRLLENPGLAIACLSLAVNLLVLPLYRRADALQEEQRAKDAQMQPMVRHIRKTFRGDERVLMLQAYYREAHYRPADALRGSLPLLLQVPFFIAAYRFLSGLALLSGEPFGPIADLGAPDGLLALGSLRLNLLPVLMTLVNFASAAVYLRGFPAKQKAQVAGMALVFLVLLYGSPAGLVFYWTLNNVFSLCKNLVEKSRNPGRTAAALSSLAGLACLAGLGLEAFSSPRRRIMLILLAAALQLPWLWRALRGRIQRARALRESGADGRLFLASALLLALLTGLVIPSAVISASAAEFVEVLFYRSPLWYVLRCALVALGTFLVWGGVFYRLLPGRAARRLALALFLLCGIALMNYMAFAGNYGNLSSQLVYDAEPIHTARAALGNAAALAAVSALLLLLQRLRPAAARGLAAACCLALAAMSAPNLARIAGDAARLKDGILTRAQEVPEIALSREGKNVVVLMLDRAASLYTPFLLEEKPELKEQFAGFTYYPNTLSYGMNTISGAPALYGGYEYTPERINARRGELLRDKHDEALRLMPVLFDEAGYDVTVCDPSLAGYSWIPDLSVYDDHPEIRTYITAGRFEGDVKGAWEAADRTRKRNFFCYSLFRIAPVFLRSSLYYGGLYNEAVQGSAAGGLTMVRQQAEGVSQAYGVDKGFVETAAVLDNLPLMCRVTDAPGAFLMMANDVPHNPTLLQEPQYEPATQVNNLFYDEQHAVRRDGGGREIRLQTLAQMSFYHVDMAMMMKLGRWMDWLREQGVYNNTRIILAADHGCGLDQFPERQLPGTDWRDLTYFNPLLMVKDFDAAEFRTDLRFMTNADVPQLALAGLIEGARNPATGTPLDSFADKEAPEQRVIYYAENWNITHNTGDRFTPARWYRVQGDFLDPDSWEETGEP